MDETKQVKMKYTKCGEPCSHYSPDKKPTPFGPSTVDAFCKHPRWKKPRRCGIGDGFPEFCPLDDWRADLKVVN